MVNEQRFVHNSEVAICKLPPRVCKLSWKEVVDVDVWGGKSVNLSYALRNGCNIPYTYCLSTDFFDYYRATGKLIGEEALEGFFEKILANTVSGKLIVRSSATCEDSEIDSYAGIFKSFNNIADFKSFTTAIIDCFDSVNSEQVRLYCQVKSLDYRKIKMAVIIQEYINADYSGILFTRSPFSFGAYPVVDLCKGASEELCKGKGPTNLYEIVDSDKYIAKAEVTSIPQYILSVILSQLHELTALMVVNYDIAAIEWIWENNKLWIVQIRPVASINSVEPEIDSVFFKFHAMKMFVKTNLFDKHVDFIEGKHIEEILEKLGGVEFNDAVKIIRFARGGDIGMPKCFVKTIGEAVCAVRDVWSHGMSLIVYDEIDVCDSYEVYVDIVNNLIVIEHIPGIWDSDNILSPDVIVSNNDAKMAYRFMEQRQAKFDSYNTLCYRAKEPIPKAECEILLEFVLNATKKIMLNTGKCRFNYHFVRDKNGRTFFLNMRNIVSFCFKTAVPSALTEIQKIEDIVNIKIGNPVFLNFMIERGNEVALLKYAQFFKDRVCCLKFGILSHPAIVLRELGAITIPLFDARNYAIESIFGRGTR
ncbi:MAG: hypothetical protein LBG15_15510 [Dysgonamonadaceae bacterium]|nr:hypothetical protein [Dysgonamonadaceae bacterium]